MERFLVKVALVMQPAVFVPTERPPTHRLYIVTQGVAIYKGNKRSSGSSWGAEDVFLSSQSQPTGNFPPELPTFHQGFRQHELMPIKLGIMPNLLQQSHRPVPLPIGHVDFRQPGLLAGPQARPFRKFKLRKAFGEKLYGVLPPP